VGSISRRPTEFLVLIAALLELKSRLMLPGEEAAELDELVPAEAADELLARMLAYLRHRGAAAWLAERAADGQRFLDRQAPLPATLRAAKLDRAPEGSLSPDALGAALGELLRTPPPLDLAHLADPRVALSERLALLRGLLRRGAFSFEDAVRGGGPDDRRR
jgi:segregation and condensation protein A